MSDSARRGGSDWLLPAMVSGLLHGAAILMLWGGWWQEPAVNTSQARVQTQLMTLTYEVAEPAPVMEPPAVEPPPAEPSPKAESEPVIDQAVIARQRMQEQQEKERQEREQQEREQQKIREQRMAEKKREQEQRQQEQELARQAQEERLAAEAEAARREAASIAQYQPIHKAPPAYPRRALDSKIEGDCTVSYTVTRDGRVSHPSVVEEACDDPIFIRPSLQAASAFRYQPRIVNGRAVVVHDVRNTFRYRIQP